jgi:hypothetical protein
MKTIIAILLLIVLVPSLAVAGKIYGIIKEGGKSVPKGIEVRITTIPDKPKLVARTQTDKNGLYRLYVKRTGKFNLVVSDTLAHKRDTLSIPIRSYRKSVRYNLLIQKDKHGKYTLKRE